MAEKESRYVFRASEAPLIDAEPALKVKEARMLDGMALRYQERSPGGPRDEMWCETGHSAYILSGRLRYEFPDHSVEIGPGDMVRIPAGPEHGPHVVGDELAKYLIMKSGQLAYANTSRGKR